MSNALSVLHFKETVGAIVVRKQTAHKGEVRVVQSNWYFRYVCYCHRKGNYVPGTYGDIIPDLCYKAFNP